MARTYRLLQLVGPDQGLAQHDLLALARSFVRQGHAMTVAGPLTRLQQEQVATTGARWVNLPLGKWEDSAGREASARQLRRLLQAEGADLLHCYGVPAAVVAARATTRLPHAPLLLATLDDLTAYRFARREAWSLRRLLARFSQLVCAAESEREALTELDARLAARARLLHLSAEVRPLTSGFDLARKRRSLGLRAETAAIGVISPARRALGLETVLAAASRINQEFPNVEFLVVGEGPDQADLILQAHHSGAGGAVVFRGARADIAEIIATLNILVIPREAPGSLSYALQALSQEIPVVAVPTPALQEVISPVDPAAFVPPDDPDALYRALAHRLEILPPPEADNLDESGLGYKDMIVSGEGFDLDQVGLEAQWRGDESEMQRAVRQAEEKYSPARLVQAVRSLYHELLES